MNHRTLQPLIACLICMFSFTGIQADTAAERTHPESLSGGEATVFETGREAFALSLPRLSKEGRRAFAVGNSFFNENWVIAPSSTDGRDGLGPLFNANSCSTCHFKDGRGTPPLKKDDPVVSMIFRLSTPDNNGHSNEPSYGGQLQNRAIPGVPFEGAADLAYEEVPGSFADGTTFSLRSPTYTFKQLAHGTISSGTLVSPRVSPAVFGLGLLTAVPEQSILKNEDPDDKDGNGISGRANHVWDIRQKRTTLGRFGWKANQPSLEQQNAAAFANDLGITSELFPEHTLTPIQTAARSAPSGGEPELVAKTLASVTSYTMTLAVPARRKVSDPAVRSGQNHFKAMNCALCHIDTLQTGDIADFPELANQTIHPYTDLLLHDLGEKLSDHRPDGEATGSEWRTPPLWGIGLVGTVNGHTNLLHDGRARNLQEAILWHGGEASDSRQLYLNADGKTRTELIQFLQSL